MGTHELGTVVQTDFTTFVELVKGHSITSLGDFGSERLELGLSGNLMLRVLTLGKELEANCFSTRNRDEPLAFTLWLGEMPSSIPLWQLEAKLRGLRTSFAIFYLLVNEREENLAAYLLQHPFGDIDRALLSREECLQIESTSYGSWVATVRAKTKGAIDAVKALVTVVFPRTRDMFLRKMEAETALKETEAKRGAVALEREKFELAKAQTDYILDLAGRIKESDAGEILHRRLRGAIYDLAAGDENEPEIRTNARRMLPPTDPEKPATAGEQGTTKD